MPGQLALDARQAMAQLRHDVVTHEAGRPAFRDAQGPRGPAARGRQVGRVPLVMLGQLHIGRQVLARDRADPFFPELGGLLAPFQPLVQQAQLAQRQHLVVRRGRTLQRQAVAADTRFHPAQRVVAARQAHALQRVEAVVRAIQRIPVENGEPCARPAAPSTRRLAGCGRRPGRASRLSRRSGSTGDRYPG